MKRLALLLVLWLPVASVQAALTDGLVFFAPANEGSGNVLDNTGSSGTDCTANATLTWTTIAPRGAAPDLAGSNYLLCGDTAIANTMTWAFWLYSRNITVTRNWWRHALGASDNSWQLIDSNLNVFRFVISADGTATEAETTSALITENEWQHIILTYNAGAWVVYKNNVSANNATATTTSLFNSTADMRIGHTSGSPDGLVQELAMWNRVITSTERAQVHAGDLSDPGGVSQAVLRRLRLH